MGIIIGRGFGNFSYVTGPWNDALGAGNNGVSFPVGIGTEIAGGDTGATITALTVEPPHYRPPGSNSPVPFRILILPTKAPPTFLPYQLASTGWPRKGDSDAASPLWSKMFASKAVNDAYDLGGEEPRTHYVWPKLSGPHVGPGEVMCVLFMFMKNYIDDFANGQIHYGVGDTLVGFTVFGAYETYKPRQGQNRDVTGRSLPRGAMR